MIIPYYKDLGIGRKMSYSFKNHYTAFRPSPIPVIRYFMPNGEPLDLSKNHDGTLGNEYIPINILFWKLEKGTSREEVLSLLKEYKKEAEKAINNDDAYSLGSKALLPIYDWLYIYLNQYTNFERDFETLRIYFRTCYDLYVQLFNFDKIERLKNTITTSKLNIYETFFNYYLMNFVINTIPKVMFNKETKGLIVLEHSDFIVSGQEREYEEEIQQIKKHVPLNERHRYFR